MVTCTWRAVQKKGPEPVLSQVGGGGRGIVEKIEW